MPAPVVPKLRLGGGISGDSCSARAAPVLPVSVPKINISRTTEPSQRSARGAGIPTMTLPPAKLDLGAQLEAALAEDDDIRPRADDSNQMFMQEVAILQMQAEGWKAEWSIAMQENERLRMALFDAENALEQLPPKEEGEEGNEANEGADDEMQWRELCTSIARAADEEKATLLEELNMVRAELEHKRSTAFSTHDDQQRAEVEANKARERGQLACAVRARAGGARAPRRAAQGDAISLHRRRRAATSSRRPVSSPRGERRTRSATRPRRSCTRRSARPRQS